MQTSPPQIKNPDKCPTASLKLPAIPLAPIKPKVAFSLLKDFIRSLELPALDELRAQIEHHEGLANSLATIFELSPFLASLATQYPAVVQSCLDGAFDVALRENWVELDQTEEDEASVMKALRQVKKRAALICGLADLCGAWTAARVSETVSETADRTLARAVDFCLRELGQKGRLSLADPNEPSAGCGYTVLAMGKHGAGELNYSSDIDIIVFIDPAAPAIIEREECVTEFVRMTKRLVKLMQERTADGYVFRTDLRLRPDPGSMPLAIPLDIAMNYYESRGQNWERAALIKARPVAGDLALGASVLAALVPFIWRRYLDYAAIADIHSIKRQIQAHRDLGEMMVPGHNVKLGRGGIREIEFFVQTQQLIAGGRMPQLRGKRTTEVLQELDKAGWIEHHVREDMVQSYGFLRDVEHRLQMIADEQTHSLPTDDPGLLVIARLCGFSNAKQFGQALTGHLNRVEAHYAALFSDSPGLNVDQGNLSFTGDDDDPGTLETLQAMGFQHPQQIIRLVKSWHYGRYPAMQSAEARQRLTELTPALLNALSLSGGSDRAVHAFDEFLKGLPAGFQLFTLLHTNPQLLGLLAKILSAAPRLARVITRRPHVFDGLLEPGFFQTLPTREKFSETLTRTMDLARSTEDGLDRARLFAQEQRFLIGIRVLGETITPDQAATAYSDLAEVMLEAMTKWVKTAFETQHGQVPGARYCILAMGNFGTRELTASSDLDLIFLYEYDPEHDESDGPKPLHASQYFGRFTQRLISVMSAPTAEGKIYELDMRLRPAGAAGPIATSLRALSKYYAENAWTWELLALTRARCITGDVSFHKTVEAVLDEIIKSPRDPAQIAKEALEMRQLMDRERPPKSHWDVKLAKGGMIDIEFIAQWAVLSGHADAGGTTRQVIEKLMQQGSAAALALQNDNMTLAQAHSTFCHVAQVARLCLDEPDDLKNGPEGFTEFLLKVLDFPDFKTADAYLRDCQKAVRKQFLEIMR